MVGRLYGRICIYKDSCYKDKMVGRQYDTFILKQLPDLIHIHWTLQGVGVAVGAKKMPVLCLNNRYLFFVVFFSHGICIDLSMSKHITSSLDWIQPVSFPVSGDLLPRNPFKSISMNWLYSHFFYINIWFPDGALSSVCHISSTNCIEYQHYAYDFKIWFTF